MKNKTYINDSLYSNLADIYKLQDKNITKSLHPYSKEIYFKKYIWLFLGVYLSSYILASLIWENWNVNRKNAVNKHKTISIKDINILAYK